MPTPTSTFRVAQVIPNTDMRPCRQLGQTTYVHRLTAGSGILFINKAQTMGRLYDSAGGIHTYYADKGTQFDLALLTKLVRAGLNLIIQPTARAAHHTLKAA